MINNIISCTLIAPNNKHDSLNMYSIFKCQGSICKTITYIYFLKIINLKNKKLNKKLIILSRKKLSQNLKEYPISYLVELSTSRKK